MRSVARSSERGLLKISAILGWVGKVVLAAMALTIVVNVVLRYLFNQPLASIVEIVELGMVIAVFFSIVVCTALQGHLDIDILVARLPKRAQAIIGILGKLIGAGLFGVIARQSLKHAINLLQINSETIMLKLPYYPFWLLVFVCCALVSLLMLAQIVHLVIKGVGR